MLQLAEWYRTFMLEDNPLYPPSHSQFRDERFGSFDVNDVHEHVSSGVCVFTDLGVRRRLLGRLQTSERFWCPEFVRAAGHRTGGVAGGWHWEWAAWAEILKDFSHDRANIHILILPELEASGWHRNNTLSCAGLMLPALGFMEITHIPGRDAHSAFLWFLLKSLGAAALYQHLPLSAPPSISTSLSALRRRF
ncbi:unnamed protein product [Pleuronectes platessa]|uniref:Uncharacterized protein n=1 Tax=Pleuronectes platessa TaxID=8262 RepID=A0A9N7U0K4_PLEPL|nr:unnamed protein product [Pleuronectes platessa]